MSEVVVIGGGVIGLSVAWETARRGDAVRLVDEHKIGSGTSWAAAGILPAARLASAIDPPDRLCGLSHELYPDWTARITQRSGIDVGFRRCGGLYLASSAGEAAALAGALDYWTSEGINARRLERDELAEQFPALGQWANARFRAAVRVDDEWQVRPPDLLSGLAEACRRDGVRIDEGVKVRLNRRRDSAVLELDGRAVAGNPTIVVCGGVWTGLICEAFGMAMSLIPIRGQMLLYRFDRPPFDSIVNEGHRYLVPREDGHVLVGSCEEEVGFRLGTTRPVLDSLHRWAAGVIPRIESMEPVRSWSGLRPATCDGYPLIGAVAGVENLWAAAGHFRSGIHLAPATAVMLAEMMEGTAAAEDVRYFSPSRVVDRHASPLESRL